MTDNSEVNRLKELGNKSFRMRKFRQALNLYTDALSTAIANPISTVPKETIQTILANRSQAYFSYRLEHDALADVNEALSAKYTDDVDSPKIITIKCLFRRARILCLMAKYEQATADYDELVQLMREMGGEPTQEHTQLKAEIDTGANAGEGSKRRKKDELMRAIDARGFLLRLPYRDNFPYPPSDQLPALRPNFNPDTQTLQFDTDDGRPNPHLSDPISTTPILIPICVRAPFFKPFSFSTGLGSPASEHNTVGECLDGLFFSIHTLPGSAASLQPEVTHSAVLHERHSSVIMMTSRGRLLLVPRTTKLKDIPPAARWPRLSQGTSNLHTFNDLCPRPRLREHEVDGIDLFCGWSMEVLVIPDQNVNDFIEMNEAMARVVPDNVER